MMASDERTRATANAASTLPEQLRAILREELEPLKQDVAGLKQDVRTNRLLLRAIASAILPEGVMAEVEDGFLRDSITRRVERKTTA